MLRKSILALKAVVPPRLLARPALTQARMCSTHAMAAAGKPAGRQVLPTDVVPKHYRVFLEPDLKAYTFAGRVEIDLDVAKTTNKVSVNVLDVDIKSVKLGSEAASATETDEDAQSITWTFPTAVTEGSKATLAVEFDGTLNDQLAGFYRSVHKDENGNEQVVATTQMEATDCRRAFPCFDEPLLKATFDISIAADKKMTVLSNSDVKSTEARADGKQVTHFNTTPKMSTYLVAFIVGELKYVESKKFRVPVRVYATPGMEQRCQFSADLAARTLAFFEETFGIEYPMPKCDMVGIHDFSAGAMENWGLITYRLTDIFFEEGKDAVSTKIRVAEVVQHELAHQWFGNLVTMEWWDGLWLNEGFATWMSWYSTNHFFPEWKVWESYVTTVYPGCLGLDGLRSSHPIQVPVQRADEINQIFDAISYLKGSCVIRMVSQFLGEDVFIKGISKYLHKHQYANTTTDDLWAALSEASGKDVKNLMSVWTKEIGYPVVTVTENAGEGTIEIQAEQHRYLKTADVKPDEDTTIYPLWLSLRRADGSVDHSTSLTERKAVFKVDSDFYKVNADQNGIFRVKYPDTRVAKLADEGAKAAEHKSRLSTEDRIGLVLDLGALAGGYSKTSQLLTLISKWRADPEPNVWVVMLAQLASLAARLRWEPEAVREPFRQLRESVVIPKLKELGHTFSSSDSANLTKLKATLFDHAITLENKEYIDVALKEFASKGFDVNANIRRPIFEAVAKFGTPEQWEKLLKHYTEGTNGVSGIDAIKAVGSSKSEDVIKRVLEAILDGTIRTQDGMWALAGVSSSTKGQTLAWAWFQKELRGRILKLFPSSSNIMGHILKLSIDGFTHRDQLEAIDAYFDGQDVRGFDKALEQSKDSIRASITFLDNDLADINKWLQSAKL